ncbi:MAG: threonine synthase [Armatimonadia bacterium]
MPICQGWPGLIGAYEKYLPVTEATPRVTLQEGNTPLIESKHLARQWSPNLRVFFKYEGLNPTGSFKDRGMTMAISKAAERGVKATLCASTGNTSASAAAYSARAGMTSVVLIPQGKIALGKLAQALAYGARTLQVDGNFDDCLKIVREVTDNYPIELLNSLNPMRMEGQKTIAFEVCDVLGAPPDYHLLPVGNAGNITAHWWGYKQYRDVGLIDRLPKMLGFQAAGAAPLVQGAPVKNPETIATAIRIGNPARWDDAMNAVTESGGTLRAVTDEEILQAYSELASQEGIFVEPASAASVAGWKKLIAEGYFGSDPATLVLTVTGHGLKDPDSAIKIAAQPEQVPADTDHVVKLLGL